MSEEVDEPDAEAGEADGEHIELKGVEVITTLVDDDGTVMIDDLVAEVDLEGRIVATDERVEIDRPDGIVIIDETFSIAGEDGQLRPIDQQTTVTEP